MWSKTLVRLSGVLIAVTLIAAACAGSTTTSATETTEEAAETAEVSQLSNSESTDDAAVEESHSEAEDSNDDTEESHSHDDDKEEDSHSHDADSGIEVDASLPIPAVDIELTETDVPGTFALAVSLENFTITEENVDGEPVDNEGHLHLYLDGERLGRFFTVDHEVVVPDGEHLVEVELSANNHSPYLIDGEPIRAGLTVTGAGEAPDAPEAAVTLVADFVDGSLELGGGDRVEVSQGDVVALQVSSDALEEIHVHGYDHFIDVGPGEDVEFLFTADIPGRFEIEFEVSHQFIAELVVS